MTKVKRSMTISTELDEVIAMIAMSKGMNYSEFVESRLRMNQLVNKKIEELEKLPEIPVTKIKKYAISKKPFNARVTKLAKYTTPKKEIIEV